MGNLYNLKHGMSDSPIYSTWEGMKQRCLNPKAEGYPLYGGRGILVCEAWLVFENFYKDMGEKPDGMTLERIDVNGNYCPENCKWESLGVQNFNKRISEKNKSGRTGVRYRTDRGVYLAQITFRKKIIHLGTFLTFEQACLARDLAELKYYGRILQQGL